METIWWKSYKNIRTRVESAWCWMQYESTITFTSGNHIQIKFDEEAKMPNEIFMRINKVRHPEVRTARIKPFFVFIFTFCSGI